MSNPNISDANPLKRTAAAAVSFFMGIIGAFVGYPFMNTMLDALNVTDPIITGIAWFSLIVLLILAILVVPIHLLFSTSNTQ